MEVLFFFTANKRKAVRRACEEMKTHIWAPQYGCSTSQHAHINFRTWNKSGQVCAMAVHEAAAFLVIENNTGEKCNYAYENTRCPNLLSVHWQRLRMSGHRRVCSLDGFPCDHIACCPCMKEAICRQLSFNITVPARS